MQKKGNKGKNDLDSLILKVLAETDLSDQQLLMKELAKRGHSITQSTLSRRLKRLGIAKQQGKYVQVLHTGAQGLIKELSLAPPNLMVIHTPPGHAQALAFELDSLRAKSHHSINAANFKHVLGTIAGDDTVLVIASGSENLQIVKQSIEAAFC